MGRPRGSRNKITQDTKQIVNKMLHECIKTLEKDLKALRPIDRINTIVSILPFLVPRLKATENKVDLSSLPTEQIQAMILNYLENE